MLLPIEEIVLFTDRDIYLSGEKIWFSAKCTVHGYEDQQLSRVLYLELFNASRKSIAQAKYRITDFFAQGVLVIPSEFISGNYYLRAYTNYMRNFGPESYYTRIITIVNPFLPLPSYEGSSEKNFPDYTGEKSKEENIIRVSTNKKHYNTREIVEVMISIPGKTDHDNYCLNVSVVKKDAFYDDTYNYRSPDKTLNSGDYMITAEAENLTWFPDIRDVSISGIVVDEQTGIALTDVLVYLYAGKKYPQVHLYKTDEGGKFIFSLNNFQGDQDVFLCPLRWPQGDEPKIMVYSDFSPDFPDVTEIPLVIDSTDTAFLEDLLTNMQASVTFDKEQQEAVIPPGHFPSPFENPTNSIVLEDYIETHDLETVFREIVPGVRLRKKDGIYSFSVFDFDKEILYEDPLVLIDKLPVFDINALLDIPADYIEKVEVHNTPLILGDHVLKGIISLTSNTEDFGGLIMPPGSSFLKFQTLNQKYKFNPTDYSSQRSLEDPRGDFRTLLHWLPQLNINSDTIISFYTSDHESEYEVLVRGHTSQGEQLTVRTSFKVIFNR